MPRSVYLPRAYFTPLASGNAWGFIPQKDIVNCIVKCSLFFSFFFFSTSLFIQRIYFIHRIWFFFKILFVFFYFIFYLVSSDEESRVSRGPEINSGVGSRTLNAITFSLSFFPFSLFLFLFFSFSNYIFKHWK